ncbi:MAG: hypothetical protein MJY88_02885 [Bacteroidales bacterium]|nr:hypothetical protein [Bacteroidales bacterium]
MKKYFKYLVAVAAAALSFASCQKEIEKIEDKIPEAKYSYTFALDETATKAILESDETGTYTKWEATDEIGVFTKDADGKYLAHTKATIDVTTSPVTFKISCETPLKAGDMVYCYYPYFWDNGSGPAHTNIEAREYQDGKMNAMPMVAIPVTLEGDVEANTDHSVASIKMQNLGGIFQFNMFSTNKDYQGEVVEKVTFNAGNNGISGTFKFDITQNDDLSIPEDRTRLSNTATVGGQSAEVGTGKEDASKVNMVVLPGSYSGTLTVITNKAEYVFEVNTPKTVERSHIKPLNVDLAKAASRTEIVSTIDFHETFNTNNGTGGNDGAWGGSNIAISSVKTDSKGWTFESAKGASRCIKLGTSNEGGSATTPELSIGSGHAVLTFMAAAWNNDKESTVINLSATNAELSMSTINLEKGQWTTYTVDVTNVTGPVNIKFASANGGGNRFFLDEVSVSDKAISRIEPWSTVTNLIRSQGDGFLFVAWNAVINNKNLMISVSETDANASTPSWLRAELDPEGHVLYEVDENTGDNRTAYIHLSGSDAVGNARTAVVKVVQTSALMAVSFGGKMDSDAKEGTWTVMREGMSPWVDVVNLTAEDRYSPAGPESQWLKVSIDQDRNIHYKATENTDSHDRSVYVSLGGLTADGLWVTNTFMVTQKAYSAITVTDSYLNLLRSEDDSFFHVSWREAINDKNVWISARADADDKSAVSWARAELRDDDIVLVEAIEENLTGQKRIAYAHVSAKDSHGVTHHQAVEIRQTTADIVMESGLTNLPANEKDGDWSFTCEGLTGSPLYSYTNPDRCDGPVSDADGWLDVYSKESNILHYAAQENTSTSPRELYVTVFGYTTDLEYVTRTFLVTQNGKPSIECETEIEVSAEGGEGMIPVIWKNILSGPSCRGIVTINNEITSGEGFSLFMEDWFDVYIGDGKGNFTPDCDVHYTVKPNTTGEDRTVFLHIWGYYEDGLHRYPHKSAVVKVTQKHS